MSAGALEIRAASPAQVGALVGLWAELDALHAALQPRFFRAAPSRASELRAMLDDPHAILLVALDGSQLVGAIGARVYDTPDDPGMVPRRRVYADRLVVAVEHRGRGVGRQLMRALEREGRARGAKELVLTVWAGNEAAARFYQRDGLVEVGRVLAREL